MLRWLFRLGLLVQLALVLLVGVLLYLAVTFVQVWQASRRDDPRPSEAIVVLGAAQYNGRPSPVFEARLDHAADLYRRKVAPTVVVTGGKAVGDRVSEATAGADRLHQLGVPEAAILRETSGRNSWESLAASARFLHQRGIHRVVLVSDPFHAERIDAIADEVGLDGHVSPTRTSPIKGTAALRRMAGEAMRVGIGRVIGFRRLMRLGAISPDSGAAPPLLRPSTAVGGAHRTGARSAR